MLSVWTVDRNQPACPTQRILGRTVTAVAAEPWRARDQSRNLDSNKMEGNQFLAKLDCV